MFWTVYPPFFKTPLRPLNNTEADLKLWFLCNTMVHCFWRFCGFGVVEVKCINQFNEHFLHIFSIMILLHPSLVRLAQSIERCGSQSGSPRFKFRRCRLDGSVTQTTNGLLSWLLAKAPQLYSTSEYKANDAYHMVQPPLRQSDGATGHHPRWVASQICEWRVILTSGESDLRVAKKFFIKRNKILGENSLLIVWNFADTFNCF